MSKSMGAGQVMIGGVWSNTVMRELHQPLLPLRSTPVQFSVVFPT
jgi:hypothetical protein